VCKGNTFILEPLARVSHILSPEITIIDVADIAALTHITR